MDNGKRRERKCADTIGTVPVLSDKIQIYFSNKIHASNFFKQHSETVSLLRFETTKMLSGFKKN